MSSPTPRRSLLEATPRDQPHALTSGSPRSLLLVQVPTQQPREIGGAHRAVADSPRPGAALTHRSSGTLVPLSPSAALAETLPAQARASEDARAPHLHRWEWAGAGAGIGVLAAIVNHGVEIHTQVGRGGLLALLPALCLAGVLASILTWWGLRAYSARVWTSVRTRVNGLGGSGCPGHAEIVTYRDRGRRVRRAVVLIQGHQMGLCDRRGRLLWMRDTPTLGLYTISDHGAIEAGAIGTRGTLRARTGKLGSNRSAQERLRTCILTHALHGRCTSTPQPEMLGDAPTQRRSLHTAGRARGALALGPARA